MTSTVLSAKVSKTSLASVDRHAGDRELALVHARLLADLLADLERGLEDRVEDRTDGLSVDRGAVGLADLAEDLALAQHQALQAGRDPEQVADNPFIVVAHQVPGEQLRTDAVELDQEVAQGIGLGDGLRVAGQVDLHPVAR